MKIDPRFYQLRDAVYADDWQTVVDLFGDKSPPPDDPRFRPLRNAAYAQDWQAVTEMLNSDPACIEATNSLGETALHFLVIENQLAAVKFLASKGANVNCPDKFGCFPVTVAAQMGYLEMFDLLLRLGATVEVKELLDKVRPAEQSNIKTVLRAHRLSA